MANYKQVKIVDTTLGSPRDFFDVQANTLAEFKAKITGLDQQITFNNKAIVVKGLNHTLELDDAVMPDTENLILLVMTRVIKGAAKKKQEVDLNSLSSNELKELAKEKKLTGYSKMNKADLIALLSGESEKATSEPIANTKNVKIKAEKVSNVKATEDTDNNVREELLRILGEVRTKLMPILGIVREDTSKEVLASLDKLENTIKGNKVIIANYRNLLFNMEQKASELIAEAKEIENKIIVTVRR
jgi:hypothetical protein